MPPYRYLEGITEADYAFEASGKDLPELFVNAALATEGLMADLKTIKPVKKKTLGLTNEDVGKLLHEFLEELIFLKDAETLLFSKFKIDVKKEKVYMLHAELSGDNIDATKQHLGIDVKAVTLHEFKVEQLKDKTWRCLVVVDV
jgi:SHS2 domain-containing protein